MGRIRGHYEWEDDNLSPGRKKEGGLHQNLFDRDGNLKGSARFVPDGDPSEPLIVGENVYVPGDERRLSEDDDPLADAIATLMIHLLDIGVTNLPRVQEWWRSTGRPMVAAKRAALDEHRTRRRGRKKASRKKARAIGGAVLQPTQELAGASIVNRPSMSSAEAQTRYLAALAARVYSDEQIRLVTSSNIIDSDRISELPQLIADLPPDQVRGLIEQMVREPRMLDDDILADLASLLGGRALRGSSRGPVPVRAEKEG